MAWLRVLLTRGLSYSQPQSRSQSRSQSRCQSRCQSRSQSYSYSYPDATSTNSLGPSEKYTPLTKDALSQLPRYYDREPYSSHSQRPRGSYSSHSHSAATSSPQPPSTVSTVSTTIVTPSDMVSSSGPSTGATTPEMECGEDKKSMVSSAHELDESQLGDSPPVTALHQLEKLSSREAGARTAKDDCPHRELAVAQSVEVPCSICGSRKPGRLLVCTGTFKPAVDANTPQNSDEAKGSNGDATDCATEAAEAKDSESVSRQLDSPFFKNLTLEELANSSNVELMAMIIERNPEHADSRCQIHSAITALRAPVPKPALKRLASGTGSEVSFLAQQTCGYVVCVKCESKVRSTAAAGPATEVNGTDAAGAATDGTPVVIPVRSSSLMAGKRDGLGRRTTSDPCPMMRRRKGIVTDWAVYHHGLQGDGWRIPRGTRPRNKLRVPRKLKVVKEEGEEPSVSGEKGKDAAPQTPTTPTTPGSMTEERITHATAHGLM